MNSIEMMAKLDRDELLESHFSIKEEKEEDESLKAVENTEEKQEEKLDVTAKLTRSPSSPNLSKKTFNLNCFISENNDNNIHKKGPTFLSSSSSTSSSSANGDTSSVNTNVQQLSSTSQVNLSSHSAQHPQTRNCISYRSTLPTNESSAIPKSVKFTESVVSREREKSPPKIQQRVLNSQLNNSSQSSVNISDSDDTRLLVDLNDEAKSSGNFVSSEQKPKKKFEFNLSRFRRRESTSVQNKNLKSASRSRSSSGLYKGCNGDKFVCSGRFCEAISKVGCCEDYRYQPKPVWKNDPQNLIKGAYNFSVYVSFLCKFLFGKS